MNELAIGLIETVGFVAAIEAADTAAKTSEIRIAGLEKVGKGLVTVVLTGELSPVQVAVDCGCEAAARLGTVHSATVIARQGDGLQVLLQKKKSGYRSSRQTDKKRETYQLTTSQLQRKRVAELRMILHSLEDNRWTKAEIDTATKKRLIAMIKEVVNEQPQ